MVEWKITVVNKTGDEGLESATVNLMLFQVPPKELMEGSWCSAWKIAQVGYPGWVGPIVLPSKSQLLVKDQIFGNLRETGPFDVASGQTHSVVQQQIDEVPKVLLASEDRTAGEIKVINQKGNAQPLEIALCKNGNQLLSFKNVRPATAVSFGVEPAIYIASVDNVAMYSGADFRAAEQIEMSTKFVLHPERPALLSG